MASLTDPIKSQEQVDRFADYVVATANSGIVWATNNPPFAEFPLGNFGGDTNGKPIDISGANLGSIITANTIFNVLTSETGQYARIRNLRAILFVDGAGGNTGSRPTPGVIFDATAVAHLNSGFAQNATGAPRSDVFQGNLITRNGLEQFFDNLRSTYNGLRGNTATIQVNVCHASCHSSCHDSRSRR